MAIKTKLPAGVWFTSKRLASGERVRYGYHGRGPECIALGREGSREFFANLVDIADRFSGSGTMRGLAAAYLKSSEFAKLAKRTQADYRVQLDRVKVRFGDLSLKAMDSGKVARYIFEWRDELAKSGVKQADYALQVLRTLLNWGKARGLLDFNRAEGVPKLYVGNRSEITWPQSAIDAFLDVASQPMRWALLLALWTGQRQGDLLQLRWSDVDGDIITLRQNKRGTLAALPVTGELRELFASIPKVADTILTDHAGMPWNPSTNWFSQNFLEAKKDAGIKGLTFHDLRGTFITRHLADGKTIQEVALMSGHSLKSIGILETYMNRSDVSRANAKRMANEQNK